MINCRSNASHLRMNLVAHYHLDRTLVNSYFTVGAATPDLLSIYNSQLRIKQRHLKRLNEEEAGRITPPFLDGLQRHFFADGIFHTSPLFHQETKRISNMLVEYFPDLDIQRKFFIGHILLELMLDKVLINLHPGILESYYGHFEALQPFRDIKKSLQIAVGHDLPNYEAYLKRFVRRKYLYHYADPKHLAWLLRRILRRVRIRDTEYIISPTFFRLMEDYEQMLIPIHEDFFTEIRAAEE